MGTCKPFTVKVKDVSKAIKKARDVIKKDGGTFKGDDTGGSFKVSGDGFISGKYTVEGTYAVKGNDVTVMTKVIADRPKIVTCEAVKEKMSEPFK